MNKSLKTASAKASPQKKNPDAKGEAKPAVAEDYKGRLKAIGGSRSDRLNGVLAYQAIQTLWTKNSTREEVEKQQDATIDALIGIKPRDELEGMLATQMIGMHNAAIECLRRGMIAEQSLDARRENLAQANKCSRTYAALLEALNRHRGKGSEQKVTVSHIHVGEGGRAVIGNVNAAAAEGGGARAKSEDQPHALGYAPGVEMPREIEAERVTVPGAGGSGGEDL